MVSVPWVITTPSACRAASSAAPAIRSQSAGVSSELSTLIRSTTSTARPGSRAAVSSSPLRAGRSTPSAPALVAMVPPVVMTTRRAMPVIMPRGRAGSEPLRKSAR